MRLLMFCLCLVSSVLIAVTLSSGRAQAQAGDAVCFANPPEPPARTEERYYFDDHGRLVRETYCVDANGTEFNATIELMNERLTLTSFEVLRVATGRLRWVTAIMFAALYGTWLYYRTIKATAFAALLSGNCVRNYRATVDQARFNILLAEGLGLAIYGLVVASIFT